jgi:hypothetical protein
MYFKTIEAGDIRQAQAAREMRRPLRATGACDWRHLAQPPAVFMARDGFAAARYRN